jgi:hypothetical protein
MSFTFTHTNSRINEAPTDRDVDCMGRHGGKTAIQYPSPSIFPQNPAARVNRSTQAGGATATVCVVVIRNERPALWSQPRLLAGPLLFLYHQSWATKIIINAAIGSLQVAVTALSHAIWSEHVQIFSPAPAHMIDGKKHDDYPLSCKYIVAAGVSKQAHSL